MSNTYDMMLASAGPGLRRLLEDTDVTEIMANPDGRVWVERFGEGMLPTDVTIQPEDAESFIGLVADSAEEVINRENPSLSAVLPRTGARFQGFVPPATPAPSFIIRRRADKVFTLQDYVDDGFMQYGHARAIYDAIHDKQNIVIVGGTGSGKTTLANAILQAIVETGDRILTIEDTPELQCPAPNSLAFYVEPDVGFTWQKAIQDALRSRPDRIVVGEVRDAAALDLLKAWNTGHPGGCCTLHANSAKRGLTRLEALVREAIPSPDPNLIAEAVDLLVYIEGTTEGREIKTVASVRGYDGNDYLVERI